MVDRLHASAKLNNLAVNFHRRGAIVEAAALWRRALRLRPDYLDAYANLATLLLQQRHPHAAWMALRHAVQLAPHAAELYVRMGSTLAEGRSLHSLPQRTLRAAAWLARSAIKLQPAAPNHWCNLGLVLTALHRPTAAAAVYASAVERDPRHAEAYLGLALAQPGEEAGAAV